MSLQTFGVIDPQSLFLDHDGARVVCFLAGIKMAFLKYIWPRGQQPCIKGQRGCAVNNLRLKKKNKQLS